MRISIQHLTKIFPSRNKGGAAVHAVEDMCIEIPSGKLVGLLGPSGCREARHRFGFPKLRVVSAYDRAGEYPLPS